MSTDPILSEAADEDKPYLAFEATLPVTLVDAIKWYRDFYDHPERALLRRSYARIGWSESSVTYRFTERRPKVKGVLRNMVRAGPAQFREGVVSVCWSPFRQVEDAEWFALRANYTSERDAFEIFGKSHEVVTLEQTSEGTQFRAIYTMRPVSSWACEHWPAFSAKFAEHRKGMLGLLIQQIERRARPR